MAYIDCMIIGYGWKRDENDLRAEGAERVYVDTKRERPERAFALAVGALRDGDTLLLLHWNDLGGNKPASDRLARWLAGRGVVVKVSPNNKRFTPKGKAKFVPTAEQDTQCRALWLDPERPAAYKLRRIGEIMGKPVTRGQLYYRYGTAENPRPE